MATLHEALQQLCDEGFLDVTGDGGSMRDIEDVLEEALAIAPFDADEYRVVRGVPGEAWVVRLEADGRMSQRGRMFVKK